MQAPAREWLYDPNEGRVLLDGIDLRDFDPAEVRSRESVYFYSLCALLCWYRGHIVGAYHGGGAGERLYIWRLL